MCSRCSCAASVVACIMLIVALPQVQAAPATCELSFMKSPCWDPITKEPLVDAKFSIEGMTPHSLVTWSCKLILGPSGGSGWDPEPYDRTDGEGCIECSDGHTKYGYYVYIFRDQGGHKLIVPVSYNAIHDMMPLPKTIREGEYDERGRMIVSSGGGKNDDSDEGNGNAAAGAAVKSPWPSQVTGTWYLLGGPKITFGPGDKFILDDGQEALSFKFRSLTGKQYLTTDGLRTCRFELSISDKRPMMVTFIVPPFNQRKTYFATRFPMLGN